MKSLTIAFITAREKPCFYWFLDSLKRANKEGAGIQVIFIDGLAPGRVLPFTLGHTVRHHAPKPNIWQGLHRVTQEDWWAMSNARNTAFCLCKTEWIAFLDDRCVLLPGWLDAVKAAMDGNYAVAGAYEKRIDMTVRSGVILHGGTVTGEDCRESHYRTQGWKGAVDAPGPWLFGCTFALPLEWALQVGGFPELADGLGMEDVLFGLLLKNSGFDLRYDPSMKIVEDRTPSELGIAMRREDKGVSPNDKSHALLNLFQGNKYSMNQFDIRKLRESVLSGKEFPVPEQKAYYDWYDSSEIK